MTRADEQRIADMLEVATQISQLVQRGRDAFDHDIAVRLAIERLLEISQVGDDRAGVVQLVRQRHAKHLHRLRAKMFQIRILCAPASLAFAPHR